MDKVGYAMSSAPGSYFVMDPGRDCGFAFCLAGGSKLRSGTWRFKQAEHGAAYAEFATKLKAMVSDLPDVQIGIELMTIVGHEDGKGGSRVDAKQVLFSSGWPAIVHTLCYTMNLRPPEMIAIQSWRSRTHGAVVTPKGSGMNQNERAKWFKEKAKAYCDRNGWKYDSADQAEALCLLDYLRQEYEPGFAFDRGSHFDHHQPDMFA